MEILSRTDWLLSLEHTNTTNLVQFRLGLYLLSTLPVDPTGLSLEAGANTVDPRDQFNPGLIRITNGEDMADNFMDLTGANIDKTYYSMMLDRRWFKFQLQSGCRRTAKPLFWSVAQLHQDAFLELL